MFGIAQQTLMHKRKMRYIQEILYSTGTTSLNGIRTTVDNTKPRFIPLRELWNIICRCTRTDPDPIVLFLHSIDDGTRSCWRLLLRVRGKTHTTPLLIIIPTMIWTDQCIILN